MTSHDDGQSRSGFVLVEVLICALILAILFGIVVVAAGNIHH